MTVTLALDFTSKENEEKELEKQAKDLADALLQLENIRRNPQKARFQMQSIGGQPFLTDLPERFSNPADVIIKEVMAKAPELGLRFLPAMLTQAREIGDIEKAYETLPKQLETLKSLLPEKDVETLKQVILQNPQEIGKITEILLDSVLEKAKTFSAGRAQLEFATSPEGEALHKLALKRKIEEMEATLPVELKKTIALTKARLDLEAQYALPEKIEEFRKETVRSFLQLSGKYLERYDKLQSRYDDLAEDVDVKAGMQRISLPDGGVFHPAQFFAYLKDAKNLESVLQTLNIPSTEANLKEIKKLVNEYKSNPEKIRKLTEFYEIQNNLQTLNSIFDKMQESYDSMKQVLPDLPDINFKILTSMGITNVPSAILQKVDKAIPSTPSETVDNKLAEITVNTAETLMNVFKPVKETLEKVSPTKQESPDKTVIKKFTEKIRKTNKIIDEEATITAIENTLQRKLTEAEKMEIISEIRKKNKQLFYLE
jgi:hypothetical protein